METAAAVAVCNSIELTTDILLPVYSISGILCTDVSLGTFVEMSLNKDSSDCHAEVVIDITHTHSPARLFLLHAL